MAVPRVPETDFRIVEGYRLKGLLARRERGKDPVGLKRFFVPGQEGYVRTPFAAKLMRRRRAARRVAHESRRNNR